MLASGDSLKCRRLVTFGLTFRVVVKLRVAAHFAENTLSIRRVPWPNGNVRFLVRTGRKEGKYEKLQQVAPNR